MSVNPSRPTSGTTPFRKVLVANRGEIAVRILRALREMEIPSVAVFSEADRSALHIQLADQAICIGPPSSSESYLSTQRILEAAATTGADAIHPGYGFLSENAAFARDCTEAKIKFIGPSSEAIARMGSKTAARQLAIAAGAPVVPGTTESLTNLSDAATMAAELGYPVLLKAAAGGGGKGMRTVDREGDLTSAYRTATSEAERAFGSGAVYLEKLIEHPRHIEVQILGDEHGHLIHLGERECSIQRRHQKVLEECPSPLADRVPGLRMEIGAAALKIARAAGYYNAGTLEFLADQAGRFYFLEMNTRLQVEHPVTELVTGVDLVRWQIRIAAGERLTLHQSDIQWSGHAIECRIYAEDPETFFPTGGTLIRYSEPSGPGVRVDSGVYKGWSIPLEYDPLLAKLCVWAESRDAAIHRLSRALAEYKIMGATTNLPLFPRLLQDSAFRRGDLDTGFLHRLPPATPSTLSDNFLAAVLAAAAAQSQQSQSALPQPPAPSSWRTLKRRELQ